MIVAVRSVARRTVAVIRRNRSIRVIVDRLNRMRWRGAVAVIMAVRVIGRLRGRWRGAVAVIMAV